MVNYVSFPLIQFDEAVDWVANLNWPCHMSSQQMQLRKYGYANITMKGTISFPAIKVQSLTAVAIWQ
jgi:hypothetical protein